MACGFGCLDTMEIKNLIIFQIVYISEEQEQKEEEQKEERIAITDICELFCQYEMY